MVKNIKLNIFIKIGLLIIIVSCSSTDDSKRSMTISTLIKEINKDMGVAEINNIFVNEYGLIESSKGISEGVNMLRFDFTGGNFYQYKFNRLSATFYNNRLYFVNLMIWDDAHTLEGVHKDIYKLIETEYAKPNQKDLNRAIWNIINKNMDNLSLELSFDQKSKKIIFISIGYIYE